MTRVIPPGGFSRHLSWLLSLNLDKAGLLGLYRKAYPHSSLESSAGLDKDQLMAALLRWAEGTGLDELRAGYGGGTLAESAEAGEGP